MAISTIYGQTSSRYSSRQDPPSTQRSDIENGVNSIPVPIANKNKISWIYVDFTIAVITFPSLLIIALFIEANLTADLADKSEEEEYNNMSILSLIATFIVISFFICGYATYRMGLRLWAGPLEINHSTTTTSSNNDDDDGDDMARRLAGGVYDLNSYLAHHFPPSYESCIAADKFPPPSYDSVYAYPKLYPVIVPVTVCLPPPQSTAPAVLYSENLNTAKNENLPSDIAIGHM